MKKEKNNKVIIFDLFGTLLVDEFSDINKGFEWLRTEILTKNCTQEKVKQIAEQFRLKYLKNRTATHKETSHKLQLNLFKTEIGFRKEIPLEQIEYGFFSVSRNTKPISGAIELLKWLKEKNYSLFIMSNTIYSAATIRSHLKIMNLTNYIDGIFTSGDYGYRKPGHKFFQFVFNEIKKNRPIKKHEIIFIGNSLEKDMLGAKKFGFTPIWLSSNTEGFGEYITDCIRLTNLADVKEYIINNYIQVANMPKHYSVADGTGNRIVIYLQGCTKRCYGCQNQSTWEFTEGNLYSIKELVTVILSHLSNYARNVTISGGEPLDQLKPVLTLIETLKRADINICLYTGYDFEDVPEDIKSKIHYLKTGAYVHELRTTEANFYGSKNQIFWEKSKDGKWLQKK